LTCLIQDVELRGSSHFPQEGTSLQSITFGMHRFLTDLVRSRTCRKTMYT